MSIWYWLYDVVIGSLECLIIGKEILGLELRKGWRKYVIFSVLILIGFYCFLHGIGKGSFSIIWHISVVCLFFQAKTGRLLLAALSDYLMIVVADSFIWSVSILFSKEIWQVDDVRNLVYGIIIFFVWVCFYFAVRKKNCIVKKFMMEISLLQLVFLDFGILAISFLFASMQGFLFDLMTMRMKKASVFFCTVVIFYIIIVYGILVQTYHKKRYLEEITQISNQYLELQKEYYMKSIEKYEELRSYRHDIRSHMQIIQSLCEQKRFEETAKYAGRLDDDYKKTVAGYTGNVIADCLLTEMLDGLKNRELAEFEVLGRLPNDLPMEDVESCILFSNAFRNAGEALQKQKQNLRFCLTAKQGQREIHIIIQNSVAKDKKIALSVTDKPEREGHGYGVKNMKKVVEKYHGSISWEVADGLMKVEIFLPVNRNDAHDKNRRL